MWIVAAWLFLAALIVLFVAASNGGRSLWLHLHWPIHRQRIRRAELCVEAAKHWGNHPLVTRRFLFEAYRLCEDCGCPVDLWPADVIAIHAEVGRA